MLFVSKKKIWRKHAFFRDNKASIKKNNNNNNNNNNKNKNKQTKKKKKAP